VQAKPVFLSKAERERLALEQRQQEVEAIRKRQEEERKARMEFLASTAAHDDRFGGGGGSGGYGSRPSNNRDPMLAKRRDRDDGGRDDFDAKRVARAPPPSSSSSSSAANRIPIDSNHKGSLAADASNNGAGGTINDQEMELIRQRYLGAKKQKRKTRKATDRQDIADWDEADDTTQQAGTLWSQRVLVKPAFGKGFIAGVDHSLQEREYLAHLSAEKREAYAKLTRQQQQQLLASGAEPSTSSIAVSSSSASSSSSSTAVVARSRAAFASVEAVNERHWSEKAVHEMTERDWRIFREDFNISTRGGSIPNPIRSWEESGLPQELLDAVRKAGYTKPSPIQMQAIPIALQGRDLIGVAETGSGKTASFVLPMLVYISKLPPLTPLTEVDGPYAVILAPTRELAQQIEEETIKFASFMKVRTVCIVGGQSIEEQGFQLRRGCEIIVATPGRLIDCLKSQYAVLNQCNYVVLDEADRMVSMGFEPQVNEILDAMPSSFLKSENEDEAASQESLAATGECVYRTTMMYSATMPPGVDRLARKYLRRAASVAIGTTGRAVDRIEQRIRFARNESDKYNILLDVLNKSPDPPIIIFANQKKSYVPFSLIRTLSLTRNLPDCNLLARSIDCCCCISGVIRSHASWRGKVGAARPCTRARVKINARQRSTSSSQARSTSWSLPMSLVVVWMSRA